jgi:hypothetical protein
MIAKRLLGTLFAFAVIGAAVPTVSEAAFAKRIGSSYGGTLSTNKSISTQQLTADPVTVLRGSTSTTYDPCVVSLDGLEALDGFHITKAFVGVSYDHGATEKLLCFDDYKNAEQQQQHCFQETGYLQVFYARDCESSEKSTKPVEDGFVVRDQDGVTNGDNTHTMFFKYIAEDPTTVAHYRLYADDGERGKHADYLVSIDDPCHKIFDIHDATVSANMIPLPAALGPGLIGLGGVVLHRLRKNRKAAAV